MQRKFLNEFRSEVGQSTTLRALASLKQSREEEISAYIRRFDLVCTRFVGTMFNDDTLKQFFIQGFFKSGTIRSILERNPQTLADAKRAAREMEKLDRDHERLWKMEDELIPQFIPIRPRIMMGEPAKYEKQVPYVLVDTGPRPLAIREPTPLLALRAPRADPHLEKVERILYASQLGFQETMIKQMQSLTDQMSLMIKSQQPVLLLRLSRVNMHRGCGVFNVANWATLVSFVEIDKIVIKEDTVVHPHKTNEVKDNLNMDMATIGDLLLEVKVVKTWRRENSIRMVEDGMHKVNVGLRDKVMVVVIIEETILWTNVINQIRLLV